MPELKYRSIVRIPYRAEELVSVLSNLGYCCPPHTEGCWVKAVAKETVNSHDETEVQAYLVAVVFRIIHERVNELTVASASHEVLGAEVGKITAALTP